MINSYPCITLFSYRSNTREFFMQGRNKFGMYTKKSPSGDRTVRSIRATNKVWQKFGDRAKQQGITRADLLEKMFLELHSETPDHRVILGNIEQATAVLKIGITSKKEGGTYARNNASSLKEKVVDALAILEQLTG